MSFFFGEPISIERHINTGAVDADENPVYIEYILNVSDVLVDFGATAMDVSIEGVKFTSDAKLYVPVDVSIKEGDVFIVRNERYVKNGETFTFKAPTQDTILEGTIRQIVPIKHVKGNVGQ